MTTTSFGAVHAAGDDHSAGPGESNWTGQPPVTPGSGILSTDWLPGPSSGSQSPVVVSFTDFHSDSEEDWQQIAVLGIKLAEAGRLCAARSGFGCGASRLSGAADQCPFGKLTRTCVVSSAGPFTSPS